jgi:hypothetical protein
VSVGDDIFLSFLGGVFFGELCLLAGCGNAEA